jgi:uncharacterized DUF497 family protein
VSDWYDESLDPPDDASASDDESQFDWDDGNLDHIGHSVTPDEAEEAVLDPHGIGTDAYNTEGERRWSIIGATETGRILYVVLTRRQGRIRIITAWDANPTDRRRYRR